ncbi:MAG: hypothetical protein U0165_11895 [Polyangiaceae bacterium]
MSILAHDVAPHLYARMIPAVGIDIALVSPLGEKGLRGLLSSESLLAWVREGAPKEMMLEVTSLDEIPVDEVTWMLSTLGPKLAAAGVKHAVFVVGSSLLYKSGTSFREVAAAHRHIDAAFFDQQAAAVRWLANRSLSRTWPPSLQEISEVLARGDRNTALTMLRALQGYTLSVAAPSLDTMAVPALMGIRIAQAAPIQNPAPAATPPEPSAAPAAVSPPAGWIKPDPSGGFAPVPAPAAATSAAPSAPETAAVQPPPGWITTPSTPPITPASTAPSVPAAPPAPPVAPVAPVSPAPPSTPAPDAPVGWPTVATPASPSPAAPAPSAGAGATVLIPVVPSAPPPAPQPPQAPAQEAPAQPPPGWIQSTSPNPAPPAPPVAPPAPAVPSGWGQSSDEPKTWGAPPAASAPPPSVPTPPSSANAPNTPNFPSGPASSAPAFSAPVLRSRSVTESHLYMDLHGARPGHRPNRIVFRGNEMVVIYDAVMTDGSTRSFEFVMPEQEYFGDRELGPGVSAILGPGELISHADTMAKSMPASPKQLSLDDSRSAAYRIHLALICMREVLKFIPPGADSVPESAFKSDLDRQVLAREPGRFSRLRLEAVTSAYESIDRQYKAATSAN